MPLDREDTSSVQHDESKDIDERPTAGFKSNALGSSCTQHEVSCYSQFSMHIEGDIATFLHHATTPSLRDRPTRVAGTLTTCQTSVGSCIQKSHQTLAPPRSHDKHGCTSGAELPSLPFTPLPFIIAAVCEKTIGLERSSISVNFDEQRGRWRSDDQNAVIVKESGARLKFFYERECNTVPVVASPGDNIASALWSWIAAKQRGWATLR
ncbi:uncharacterized protein ARMOST_19542 [Armillaria ostoyae]|uniref:Uncharacterized protein n=1 Tax=Armillaria ostoyae TaxID=47428 RepID=A0A284S4W3_ARMOS|nr:uncharacterized protein ARMOST_19542 [Armillaria ostoyae]